MKNLPQTNDVSNEEIFLVTVDTFSLFALMGISLAVIFLSFYMLIDNLEGVKLTNKLLIVELTKTEIDNIKRDIDQTLDINISSWRTWKDSQDFPNEYNTFYLSRSNCFVQYSTKHNSILHLAISKKNKTNNYSVKIAFIDENKNTKHSKEIIIKELGHFAGFSRIVKCLKQQ